MTDLMEALFYHLNERLGDYLATDSDYRINSARRDAWSLELPNHLDPAGQELFHSFYIAFYNECYCERRAMFQATLDLTRELNALLHP